MTYYATCKNNNGRTFLAKPYEYKSKAKAIKNIKECCKGGHFQQPYNASVCEVWHLDKDGNRILDYSGHVYGYSQRVFDTTEDDRDYFERGI